MDCGWFWAYCGKSIIILQITLLFNNWQQRQSLRFTRQAFLSVQIKKPALYFGVSRDANRSKVKGPEGN